MEGLGELTFDDYGDDCQARAIEINKDWCKPLQASMSRLAQMQPSVCNMFLQDAGSLKPPKSMTKLPRQRKQQKSIKQGNVGTKLPPYKTEEENGSSEVSQDSIRGLSKTTAWGSNSSIPDLLARQKAQISARPSSASRFPPRNRPESAGNSRRPQSAKDFLSEKKDISKDLGVRGSKKQVDSRQVVLTLCNSDSGSIPKERDSEISSFDHLVVRNSPVPNPQDSPRDEMELTSKIQDELNALNAGANHTKCNETDEPIPKDLPVRVSQEEDKPVTPPMPESICFSLPNMNDGSDEDGRDDDELDTDRLLEQADSFMQKKSKEEQQTLDNLVDANATIPNTEIPHEMHQIRSAAHFDSTSHYDPDCAISNVAAHNSSNIMNQRKASHNKTQNSKTDSSNNNINNGQALRSPHVTWSDSHTVLLFQADSPSQFDDDMTNGMRSSTVESNKTESISNMGTGKKIGHKNQPKPETFKNHNQTFGGSSDFLMPDEGLVSYKPLEVTKPGGYKKSSGTKNRPSLGKKEISSRTVDYELQLGADPVKSRSSTISSYNQAPLVSCLSQKSVTDGQSHVTTEGECTRKLVPTVTLAYGDENDETQEDNDQIQHRKMKLKKKKSFDEIETYMSLLDKEEVEISKSSQKLNMSSSCLCGDVPCGELLAQTSQLGTSQRPEPSSRLGPGLLVREKTPVVKTTKTIEFCDGATPAETVIKNTLMAAHQSKLEKPESNQKSDTLSLLRPSMIKRQQASETKAKSVEAKKITTASESVGANKHRASHISSRDSSAPNESEGGLAPPKSPDHTEDERIKEEKSDQGLYETMLEEAKAMALSSMKEAVKIPTPGKKKACNRPRPSNSASTGSEAMPSSVPRSRPLSAPLKISSAKSANRPNSSVPSKVNSDKHKYCQGHIGKDTGHTRIRRAQTARPQLLDSLINQEDNSPEMHEAQRMQMKMAAMGVQIDASVLERALFPPSGKSIYYNIPGDLPRNPTEMLIPHYKHWLAEDYHRVKLMERRLARDDEIKYMQKVAAEKKALAQKKGKKKKRKEKCETSVG